MREFLKGSSFKVLIIAVVVLAGFLLYTGTVGSSFLANMLGLVSSPMQGVSTTVTGSVLEFVDLDGMSKSELKEYSQQLAQENASLREQVVEYDVMKKENEQLKTQLNITNQNPDNEMVACSVIGRDPSDLFYGFSIDKGTVQGIAVGDPVICEQGLVGTVTEAYATTSKVTCILSEDLKVSAMSRKREESGVLTSNVQTAATGMVRLSYLSGETTVEPGDIITTSGAGGLFPQDIIIGQVQSVEKSENDISRYALVKPYEDLKTVSDVFVIISFPGKGETPPQVDFSTTPAPGEEGEDIEP